MGRAVSISELLNTKFNVLDFDGEFEDLIGKPELRGAWFIWGLSSNGKTSFVLQLVKYMCRFGRVAYNSMEEGKSQSMKTNFQRNNMIECGRKLILLDNEKIDDLKVRLRKQKSPKIIVIDSLQYSGMNYREFVALRDEFPNKLFIIISHADGKKPDGRVAKSIHYDAFVKIHIEGFMASAMSRYLTIASVDYTIWQEGADKYWQNLEK